MIVEMENYKFEVKRVTHLKAIDKLHLVTLLSYIFLGIVLLLLSDALFGFAASNFDKEKHSCL